MTSRERVIAAINHQQPDRCPIDLGACGQTGINVSSLYRLRKALHLDMHPLVAAEPFQMLGEVEEDLRRALHCDVIGLWNRGKIMGSSQPGLKEFKLDDGTPTLIGRGLEYDVNEKGDRMVYACGDRSAKYAQCMPKGGTFFDNVDHYDEPFDMDMDEEDMKPREDFRDDFRVCNDEDARYWEEKSHELYEQTDYGIMGVLGGAGFGDAAWIPGPTVKHPKGIRRMEDWLVAHMLYPDYIEEVFSLQEEVMLKNLEIYKQAVGDRIQVIWVSGTDFGTQNGLFLNRNTFRQLYKLHYQRVNDWIHKNTNWKTFYHSCGCVNDLLDDFVDVGVDCLNPVQFSAMEPAGMSPEKLKARYGDKLVFWGGGVDTQRVLPFGTPEEVRQQVQERISVLGQGGGYVFSTIHNIVSGVPAENLVALYEAASGMSVR